MWLLVLWQLLDNEFRAAVRESIAYSQVPCFLIVTSLSVIVRARALHATMWDLGQINHAYTANMVHACCQLHLKGTVGNKKKVFSYSHSADT